MRLRLTADPDELRNKSGALIKALAQSIDRPAPELAAQLRSLLPEAPERALRYPLLQTFVEESGIQYQRLMDQMLREIDGVLAASETPRLEKSGGPYIGPKGGKWADPQHTVHWEEPVPSTHPAVTTVGLVHPAAVLHDEVIFGDPALTQDQQRAPASDAVKAMWARNPADPAEWKLPAGARVDPWEPEPPDPEAEWSHPDYGAGQGVAPWYNADWAPDLHKYEHIVINTSGGKDSQAMLDRVVQVCRAQGVPLDRVVAVHCDLGRAEWEGTKELARRQAAHYGVRFEVVRREQNDLIDAIAERHEQLKEYETNVGELGLGGVHNWQQALDAIPQTKGYKWNKGNIGEWLRHPAAEKMVRGPEETDKDFARRVYTAVVWGQSKLGAALKRRAGDDDERHGERTRTFAAAIKRRAATVRDEYDKTLAEAREEIDRAAKAVARAKSPATQEKARTRSAAAAEQLKSLEQAGDPKDWALDFGEKVAWPTPRIRYCTSDHKRAEVNRLISKLVEESHAKAGKEYPVKVLNAMGLRAQESEGRDKMIPFSTDTWNNARAVDEWLPIHRWPEERVWMTIRNSGVPHHVAYDLGMRRLSCCFCIFATRGDLLIAAKHNPTLFKTYLELEDRIGHSFTPHMSLHEIADEIERKTAEGYSLDELARWVKKALGLDLDADLVKAELESALTGKREDLTPALIRLMLTGVQRQMTVAGTPARTVALEWKPGGLCIHLDTETRSRHVTQVPYPAAYRASLVAALYAQTRGLDFEETNPPKAMPFESLDKAEDWIREVPSVRQTTNYTCGAAALKAVLAYYGIDRAEKQLARELGTTPEDGTEPEAIVRVAQDHGLVGELREKLELADIQHAIAADQPVIVPIQAWADDPHTRWSADWDDGHYVVVLGFEGTDVVYEDPSLGKRRGRLPQAEFLERWHDRNRGQKIIRGGIFLRHKRLEKGGPAHETFPSRVCFDVRVVDGRKTREQYNLEFMEGGHHLRWSFIPKNEIWLEREILGEARETLYHEIVENLAMKWFGFTYDDAHDLAIKIEQKVRDYRREHGLRKALVQVDVDCAESLELKKSDLIHECQVLCGIDFEKGGPYIGPKGGKWADPKHTVHWDPDRASGKSLGDVIAAYGGKVKPHHTDPSLEVMKVPPEHGAVLTKIKQQYNLPGSIIQGEHYHILEVPKGLGGTPVPGTPEKAPEKKPGTQKVPKTPSQAPQAAASGKKPAIPPYMVHAQDWKPHASIQEAREWAEARGVGVGYKDLATANAVNRALADQHPWVLKHMKFVGGASELAEWAKGQPELVKLASHKSEHPLNLLDYHLGGGTIARADPLGTKPYTQSVVGVTDSWATEEAYNAHGKEPSGYSQTTSLTDTLRHEMGHVEAFVLRHLYPKGQGGPSSWEVWKRHCLSQLMGQTLDGKKTAGPQQLHKDISQYGGTNPHECWAEVSVMRRKGTPLPGWVHEALGEMGIDQGPDAWEKMGAGSKLAAALGAEK